MFVYFLSVDYLHCSILIHLTCNKNPDLLVNNMFSTIVQESTSPVVETITLQTVIACIILLQIHKIYINI